MNQPFRFKEQNPKPILLCFSHLRWDFVFQRPQHLMRRAVATHQVFYIEEADHAPGQPHFRMRLVEGGVAVLTPVFDRDCDAQSETRSLVQGLVAHLGTRRYVHWFYTPQALGIAKGLPCDLCIYDCMDELSAFRFAPPDQRQREAELMARADLVFTGGASLFAAKRDLHPNVRLYPSSVDVAHFAKSRVALPDPVDQAPLPAPRIGFFGVIDERMDLELVAYAAAALADVQFVMLGPVTKIDPALLPRASNIHWLGKKTYAELPSYLANWQAGWMPFALNDATRFISPTKTPEYLAAGLPVVSTGIRDVVATYGDTQLVQIADQASISAALRASLAPLEPRWRARVDAVLASMSWDQTWAEMCTDMQAEQCLLEGV